MFSFYWLICHTNLKPADRHNRHGNVMRKSLLIAFLIALMISGLAFVGSLYFGAAQSGTNVTGIISSDTIWTMSNSPYTLTGNTLVYQGVTLTIQPGVVVNLGSFYIEVNGTLSARGNPTYMITFNGGQITFTSFSNGWNEQTDSGCLIENAIINQTSINGSNPLKIDSSIINGKIYVTSSIISDNTITSAIDGSQSVISNNVIKSDITSESSVISNNTVTGNIQLGYISGNVASGDSSTVSNNIINGSISAISREGKPEIFNNTISTKNGNGIGCSGYGSIFNNYIYGCQDGISLYTVRGLGGNLPCYATVENNLVVDNTQGIVIGLSSVFGPGTICPTILNNTISGNSVGISLSESNYVSSPTILNNNLQNNSNYNFYLAAPNNVDVTYNWWGTTDQQAINQTIYDFKDDFTLGVVNFVPFLTAPNPQAPNLNVPIPTPASTQSPSPSPTTISTPTPTSSTAPSSSPSTSQSQQPLSSLTIELIVAVMVIVIMAVAIGAFLLGKKAGQK
jgi:hypothetical protein